MHACSRCSTWASRNTFVTDWDAKFTYNFWRPVTAIRNGDQDGNDATERDAGVDLIQRHPDASGISVAGGDQTEGTRRLVFQFPCSYISPYSSLVGNLQYV